MDGWSCTKLIRKLPDIGKAKTPIIGLTGEATKESVEKCIQVGMNDVLTKPVELSKLLKVLKKYLSKK